MSAPGHPPVVSEPIVMGCLSGLFGTRGWFKVYSYTRPRENIFSYSTWLVRFEGVWLAHDLRFHRKQGASFLAGLGGIEDRDAAARLLGCDVAIEPQHLPRPQEGEYYWIDLLGMCVSNLQGVELGAVTRLYETGGHDVLAVRGAHEHLIPFVREVFVFDVDLADRRIIVDWHPGD